MKPGMDSTDSGGQTITQPDNGVSQLSYLQHTPYNINTCTCILKIIVLHQLKQVINALAGIACDAAASVVVEML